jgi:hypothetical protein
LRDVASDEAIASAALAGILLGLDPLATLRVGDGFEVLLLRALVEKGEELRQRHAEELVGLIVKAIG